MSKMSKQEVTGLVAMIEVGIFPTAKELAEKALKQGFKPDQIAAAFNKAFDNKIMPALQKNYELKGPKVDVPEPEQRNRLGK